MSVRSSAVRKVSEITRNACNSLVRDYHEIQRLQGYKNLPSFFQIAYDKIESSLLSELRDFNTASGSRYKLVLFPIEGKENFFRGIPEFTVSVLLKKDDEAFACVVEAPMSYTTFYAESASGAYLEDLGGTMRLKIKNFTNINNIIALLNYPEAQLGFGERRMLGCDSLSACYLAAGRADVLLLNTETVNPELLLLIKLLLTESGAKEVTFQKKVLFSHLDLCEKFRQILSSTK